MNKFSRSITISILIFLVSVSLISCNSAYASDLDLSTETSLVDSKLMGQITEGMTYKEVTEILGTTGTDVGYGAIIFEYHLSDGKTARIWLQKDGSNDVNNYCVDGITIE